MSLNSLDLPHAKSVLIELLKGKVLKTKLQAIAKNFYSLNTLLTGLENDGLIKIDPQPFGKNIKYISLTPSGVEVAQKLIEAENSTKEQPIIKLKDNEEIDLNLSDEEAEKAKILHLLYHINVMDDHVTVEEILPGKPSRIFNIYIRQNDGGTFRLWCEFDNSYDCWHVKAAWTYPQVQKMMMHYKGKTKICPACGYENPEEAVYCMKCATKLD